jgi:ADP-ribose pyrophosphatase YjhB (NUDIX family)
MHKQAKMQLSSAKKKTEVLYGSRISSQGDVRVGCSVILFNDTRDEVLLTRRTDNGQWCLPGGRIDPGESVTEACEREVLEETGLIVHVVRLTGIYSNPNLLIVYPDGNKAHVIVLNFEVEQVGGMLGLSDETTDARYFPVSEAVQMKLFHNHADHIRDALSGKVETFIR